MFIKSLLQHFLFQHQRRAGGSIKADTKIGFTFVVAVELNASKNKEPFLIFAGVKMDDAKTPASRLQTNDYKFSTWRKDEFGLSFVNFQHKHWFDEDITIRHLKALVNEMCPNLKVGLTWDQAPQHCGQKVASHIQELQSQNRLIVKLIPAGLTLVIQVYNLHSKKRLKQLIKSENCKWQM